MATETNPKAICPVCGHGHQLATSLQNPEVQPTPGDFTICIQCCSALVYTDDLLTRLPTPAELQEIENIPEMQTAIRNLKAIRAKFN